MHRCDFLDWLGDPEDVALDCSSTYEYGELKQAAADHPALADRRQAAKAALIDLKEEAKRRPYFSFSSYSIKEVSPVCRFHWSQDDVDGPSAQLMYVEWLTDNCAAIEPCFYGYARSNPL